MTVAQAAKIARFRELHAGPGVFVMPNPWDLGSTRLMDAAGFAALATTSAGAAYAQGRADGAMTLDLMLENIAAICAATDLPVNADFEHGYALDHETLAHNVTRCVGTGVAGLSIEDSTSDPAHPLFDIDEMVARLEVARRAIDATGTGVVLTGRAEAFLVGHPDPMAEVLRRLPLLAAAGADCLYAPGIRTAEQIAAVIEVCAPKPVNVLVGGNIGFTVADLDALGVRRISLGSALARVSWGAVQAALEPLTGRGSFEALRGLASVPELNQIFGRRD